ncbi:hypothetical protein GCM10017559_24220 [Streptosporangium longisporum]|uniref:Uncharacterized protein n=1 Tax=Streptosporangium longisporum TaxID=46187 RepID=A0ABN3XW02_9ACTN
MEVSWGRPDPAGASADAGEVGVPARGLIDVVALGREEASGRRDVSGREEVLGRGDDLSVPSAPSVPSPGLGVDFRAERDGDDVGEGEETAPPQSPPERSGVGFAARDGPEGDLVASQSAEVAMIVKTTVNRMTFRQSNDSSRSGCQSDACSESRPGEALPRPKDPACPSGKSDARHDIGPNIRLTVIYWEGKGPSNRHLWLSGFN